MYKRFLGKLKLKKKTENNSQHLFSICLKSYFILIFAHITLFCQNCNPVMGFSIKFFWIYRIVNII